MSIFSRDKTDEDNRASEVTTTAQPQSKTAIAARSLSSSHLAQITLLASDLTINGDITSKGEIHIDGKVEGDIRCAAVTINEGGQVTGSVVSEEAMIGGLVLGTVRSLKVTLRSTAHVEGDVIHNAIGMEQGAYFDGTSRRSENPIEKSPHGGPTTSSVK